MKKIVSAVLCVLLLAAICTALAADAGTASNPLISLSYITDTFSPDVLQSGKSTIDTALGSVYSSRAAYLDGEITGAPDGYTATDGTAVIPLASGSSVSLVSGSTASVLSGSVSVSIKKGAVVSLTSGSEIASGSKLSVGTKTLVAESSSADFTASGSCLLAVGGYYRKDGGTAPAALPFTDVSSSQWFYDAVSFVYNNGYMNGVSASEFGVSQYTTRAVFVTALYRMAGSPSVTGSSRFSDVADKNLYYYSAVMWSNDAGIVLGHEDGTFRPGDSITREQMAAIMYRFVRYTGRDTSNADDTAFSSFPDRASVSSYAADAVKWATSNGIINGMDGKINPGGTALRTHVAQIILNFYDHLA